MTLSKSAFRRDTIFDSAGYSAAALNRGKDDIGFSQSFTDSKSKIAETIEAEPVITLEEHELALQAAKTEAFAQGKQEAQVHFEAEMAERKQRLDALIQVLSGQIEEPAALYQLKFN